MSQMGLKCCACCRSYRAFYILNWIYRYFTEPVKIQVLGEFT